MERRAFVAFLAAPLAAQAQSAGKVYRIGYLSLGSTSDGVSCLFRDTLRQRGYVEGRNLTIEARFADAKVDTLPYRRPGAPQRRRDGHHRDAPARAAKAATTTLPIVMAGGADPVEHGFITTFAKPGGNVTGVTHSLGPKTAGKGLALKEAVPRMSRVALYGTQCKCVAEPRSVAGLDSPTWRATT
jgi:putative tryptophan/tyrosine transport system substrate-binding protein